MKNGSMALVLALWAAASTSMAQNSVPHQDSYEGYAVGSNLVGAVWQGNTNSANALVTNGTPTEPSVGYPITNANHLKVMAFSEGPITNEFDGSTAGLTVVALDTMVQPIFAEGPAGDQLVSITNSQVSLYMWTNGFLNVFHGIQNYASPSDPNDGWAWTTLTNTTAITPGAWFRLSIVMNYDSVVNGPVSMFKVAINGTFINSPDAYSLPDISSSKNGPWFVSPKWTADLRMHRIILSGSGKLDDLVVATNETTFTTQSQQYATNGVPIDWMSVTYNISTNSTNTTWDLVALDDPDHDGAPTWTEYIAGTDPTNPSSKLVIVSSTISNGFPVLKWIGSANARSPYIIQWSSNLTSIAAWTNTPVSKTQTEGINEVTLPNPGFSPAFLRVTVTN